MGPPQVPSDQVLETLRGIVGTPKGLTVLLGVTPGLVDMARPLVAYDLHAGMIRAAWPGDLPWRRAEVADWRALPLDTGSAACVIGDGSFSSVPDAATLDAVLAECRRTLGRDGLVAVRLFARPENCPELRDVLSNARAHGVVSLNVLRWQIAAALAESHDWSVAVADILRAAEEGLGPLDRFAETAMKRIWKAQHFSWWMTTMLHVTDDASDFDRRRQLGELRSVVDSRAGRAYLAEAYTGWPFTTEL